MPVPYITRFLDSEHAGYRTLQHARAFTARQTAEVAHIPKQELAKTVLVQIDGHPALAVLPANKRINESLLCAVADAESVSIAKESDFLLLFPDCELGAMPPLGDLFHLDVYADESLADDEQIAFNAGTHTELIQMSLQEFIRVAHPIIGTFALPL